MTLPEQNIIIKNIKNLLKTINKPNLDQIIKHTESLKLLVLEEELRNNLKKEYYDDYSIIDKFIDSISICKYHNGPYEDCGHAYSQIKFKIKTEIFDIDYNYLYYIRGPDVHDNTLTISTKTHELDLNFNDTDKYYKQVENIMDLLESEQYDAKICCSLYNIILSILEFFGINEINENLIDPIEEYDEDILKKLDELHKTILEKSEEKQKKIEKIEKEKLRKHYSKTFGIKSFNI
jgi:hypothetical protein